jgi:lysophospholipase L1-like esterase
MHLAAILPLAPILWLQGRHVRRVTPILPEVAEGRTGEAGDGPPLRLLILGDSAAAGVGVTRFADTLAGRLTWDLARDRRVSWCIVAKTGRTAGQALRALEQAEAEPCDAALVSLGVNDATSLAPVRRFLDDYAAIVAVLRERFGARLILATGMPPLGRFPALPQPLRFVMGRRALRLDRRLAARLAGEAGVRHMPQDVPLEPRLMAPDGYHPGPEIYRLWAGAAAAAIRDAPVFLATPSSAMSRG